MLSHCGAVCLLVLLASLLAAGLPFQFVDPNLQKTHEYVAVRLGLSKPHIGEHLLFKSIVKSINTSCQRQDDMKLMSATLDIYMRVFSSILQQDEPRISSLLDDTELVSAVEELQRKMQELKGHLTDKLQKKEDFYAKLSQIQVDDPLTQKRVLAQFKEVFQVASMVFNRCSSAHSNSQE